MHLNKISIFVREKKRSNEKNRKKERKKGKITGWRDR